jgi:hypothetical protein
LGGESRVGKGKKKSPDDMIKRWETAAKNLDGVKLNIPEESGEYGVLYICNMYDPLSAGPHHS